MATLLRGSTKLMYELIQQDTFCYYIFGAMKEATLPKFLFICPGVYGINKTAFVHGFWYLE